MRRTTCMSTGGQVHKSLPSSARTTSLKVMRDYSQTVGVIHQLEYLVSVERHTLLYDICRRHIISTAYRSGGRNCFHESRIRMSMSNVP